MNHEMKLKSEPFDLIKSSKKIIEVRLFDQKRQLLNIEDAITFTKLPELNESINTKIIGLLRYPDFESLFRDFPAEYFGAEGWSVESLSENMYQYYSKEEVKKFGVLGIKIKLL